MFIQKKVETTTKAKLKIEDIRDYLPLGSIVQLQDTQKYMIAGMDQFDKVTKQDYDYVGVLYPEGILGVDPNKFFDHADITRVVHMGYVDEDYENLLDLLTSIF